VLSNLIVIFIVMCFYEQFVIVFCSDTHIAFVDVLPVWGIRTLSIFKLGGTWWTAIDSYAFTCCDIDCWVLTFWTENLIDISPGPVTYMIWFWWSYSFNSYEDIAFPGFPGLLPAMTVTFNL